MNSLRHSSCVKVEVEVELGEEDARLLLTLLSAYVSGGKQIPTAPRAGQRQRSRPAPGPSARSAARPGPPGARRRANCANSTATRSCECVSNGRFRGVLISWPLSRHQKQWAPIERAACRRQQSRPIDVAVCLSSCRAARRRAGGRSLRRAREPRFRGRGRGKHRRGPVSGGQTSAANSAATAGWLMCLPPRH